MQKLFTPRAEQITVDAVSAKLFEENANPLKKATISAILSGSDIHNYHMVAYINGYALHAKRFLAYAKEHHAPGLPEGALFDNALDEHLVVAPIKAYEKNNVTPGDTDIVIVRPFFNAIDINFYGAWRMQDIYSGWSTKRPFFTINGVHFSTAGFHIGKFGGKDVVFVKAKSTTSTVIDVPIGPVPEGTYAQVVYRYRSASTDDLRYWVYKPDGTWPDIDSKIEDTTPYGELFYPIIPIRIDGKMLSEERHGDLYTTSARAIKKLYLNITDLQDALEGKHLDDNEEKPDMNDIDDSWLMFGLDIYSEVPESAEYFYRFFHGLHKMTPLGGKDRYQRSVSNIFYGVYPDYAYYEIAEDQFKLVIQYNYSEQLLRQPGNLQEKYEKEVVYLDPKKYIYNCHDGDGNSYLCKIFRIENSYIVLKKQNYDVNKQPDGTHDEIIMDGIIHISTIARNKYAIKYIEEEYIGHPSKAGTSGFYLPVSHVSLNEMHDAVDREIVIYDSLMLAVYAINITKLKWYQTSIFKVILQIAMLAIAVFLAMNFGPPGLSLAVAFMEAMITVIIITMVSIAVELIIKEVGGTLGTILAIVLVIAIVIAGKFNFNFDTFKGLPWFDQLWKASQIFVEIGSKAMDVYVSAETMAIQEDYAELLKDTEEKQEELDEAWDLLGPQGSPYDPLYIAQNTTMMNPNETPTDFYDRVLNIGNIVEISLDQCEDYVANALALPEPDNSDHVLVS